MSRRERPLTGRRVLAIGLGAFAVVLAVNAVFVAMALTSWTGLDRRNAYVDGLAYNETLARAAAQKALGWRLDWEFRDRAVLEVRLQGADGLAVTGVEVTAELRRPTHEGEDQRRRLSPSGDGVFRSDAAPLAPGNWNVVLLVARDGETVFRREERLWVTQ